MTKIVLIDKDKDVLISLKQSLEGDGYRVFTADTSRNGLKLSWQRSPDIVILDLLMPKMDGFETCRRLRELGIPSILVKTAKHDERSVVKALDMGADDVLYHPVAYPVLQAKIRTLLRRNKKHTGNSHTVYDDGEISIDLNNRLVEVRGQPVKLTPTEFRLLSILIREVGRVVTHEELIQEIWGTDKEVGLGSLKLYIHYLRQKIEDHPKKPRYLLAEWGIGYRLKEPVATSIMN